MAKDWTKISKQYKGLWIALDKDEVTVLASAKTAKAAWFSATQKGHAKPILTKVPSEIISYVGSALFR